MADLLLKRDSPLDKLRFEHGGSFFFYLILLLFFVAAAGYGGLLLLNKEQEKTKEELLSQIKSKEEELRPELLDQIFLLDARLKNMSSLISQHLFPSNIVRFLESNTHPQIRFLNFNFTADSRKLDMAGEAVSYAALAQQISALEKSQNVETIEFGGLSLGTKNLVNFKLAIIFKPSLLGLRP